MALVKIGTLRFDAGVWSVQNAIGGMTLLWGPSGSYKSFLAVHTAVCVAAGRPWFGKHTTQGAVVYVVGEGGLDQFGYRCEMAARTLGLSMENLPVYARTPAVNLIDPGAADTLISEWESIDPKLIIIDTLSRCFNGDENKQDDMQKFVNTLDKIKDKLKCTVMPIHHANKEGDLRGSTVLRAAVDVEIHVTKSKKQGERVLNLKAEKMKDLDSDDFYPRELIATQMDVRFSDGDLLLDDMGAKVNTLVLSEKPEVLEYEQVTFGSFISLVSSRHSEHAVGYKEWLIASGLPETAFRRGVEGLMAQKKVESPCAGQYFEHGRDLKFFDPGENYDTEHDERMRRLAAESDESE
jgi:hypothetical protein